MPTNPAKALWFEGRQKAAIREELLPELAAGWCEIQATHSAVSPGTERLIFCSGVPQSHYQEMRCSYMGGQFPFPVKYGYSLVGRIIRGAQERLGELVHVMHPHQDRCLVRQEDLFPIPQGIPPQRAALASNLETALNATWDARINLGERALVVGFGGIGSLLARLLSFVPGLDLEVIDIIPDKIKLAQQLGFRACLPEQAAGEFDLAFNVSGSESGLQTAIDRVGFEGRVIELSWYGTQTVSLQLGGTFHSQRKAIISSQVAHLPFHLSSRWHKLRRKALVFQLLQRPEFDDHITDVLPFAHLPELFHKWQNSPPSGLAYIVEYK